MKIKPAPGTAFVIEDQEDFSSLEKIGISVPEDAKKGVGSTGVILSITNGQEGALQRVRHWLLADKVTNSFNVGQHVIYDKFIASDIYIRDENGQEIKRLKSIPIDCILGIIC